MSLKAELEKWVAALEAYDAEPPNFETALSFFSDIADSSKILTNMGLIYAALGEHETAVERFIDATGLDPYLAVAYFQCGVSNFLLERYELAHKDFEEAYLYLRGNENIRYAQLGLDFSLYPAEVLFNQAVCLIYMGRVDDGMACMEEAKRIKATDEHKVIDEAIAVRGEGFTVFSIPVGVLYRPPGNKVKNLKAKDYLGKARLVNSSDARDMDIGFSGMNRLQQGITPTGIFIDGETGLARSNTRAPRLQNNDDGAAALGRSKTTLNVVSRPSGGDSDRALSRPVPAGAGPTRNNTMLNTARASPNVGTSSRGGSPPASNKPLPSGPPPPSEENTADPSRLTAIYDDYLSYNDEPVPPMPKAPQSDRIAPLTRSNVSGAPLNSQGARSGTQGAPMSSYVPSSYGGGSVRRRGTRQNTTRRMQSAYEEEEGYASGEELLELSTIRVRVHLDDDVRGMALSADKTFEEFMNIMTSRFGRELTFKFTDEDGFKVSLKDEFDYDLAMETARESSKGKPEGKLEIWCSNA
ncbi:hypothetical protein K438DRAFT_1843854 [Mycena galopus ATCC 62051]|nr:hypothetical protein K438DRAFT_1843854 [Mycena galopus ATCC 62051]